MAPQNRSKSSPYHHGELREALIRNAIAIIEKHGVQGLSLRKAARQTGVSHSAPAHHFGDMQGLLAALAQRGFEKMTQQMVAAIDRVPERDPLERLRLIGLSYINFSLQHPAFFRVMHHPQLSLKSDHPELSKASTNTFALVKQIIAECQREEVIGPGDPQFLSLFVWSTVHGLATLAVDQQLAGKGLSEPLAAYAEAITQLIYTGLMPRD